MDLGRPWITVSAYCAKHNIPHSTVYGWIREGRMRADESSYPKMVLDEGPAPRKVPEKHRWRYEFPDISHS